VKPADINWCADTLTDTTTSSPWWLCQAWRSDQARSSTHRPISVIRPDRSASGISTVGGTKPRLGCVQRKSASTPPVGCGDNRLVFERQLTRLRCLCQRQFEAGLVLGEMQLAQVEQLMAFDAFGDA
jgi:hypothetical protein